MNKTIWVFGDNCLVNLTNSNVIKYVGYVMSLLDAKGNEIAELYKCNSDRQYVFLLWFARELERNGEQVIYTVDVPKPK